jgi:hypothetical protein
MQESDTPGRRLGEAPRYTGTAASPGSRHWYREEVCFATRQHCAVLHSEVHADSLLTAAI